MDYNANLIDNNEWVREILKNSNIGLFTFKIDSKDTSNNALYADNVMLDLLGLEQNDDPVTTYKHWEDLIHVSYKNYVISAVKKALSSNLLIEVQYIWQHPKEGAITVRCAGQKYLEENGNFYVRGYHQNVSSLDHIKSKYDDLANKMVALRNQMIFDPLTGLYNRSAFEDKVSEFLTNKKNIGNVAFVMLDLDYFKYINDVFGHFTGDVVLREAGQLIKKTMGEKCLAGRMGGDEFAIFITENAEENCIEQKLKVLCDKIHFLNISIEKNINSSFSIGATIESTLNNDFNTLYQNADESLYHTKSMGKDGFSIYQHIHEKEVGLKKTVLLIDSDENIFSSMTDELGDEFNYLYAKNLQEVKEVFSANSKKINLIILGNILENCLDEIFYDINSSNNLKNLPILALIDYNNFNTSSNILKNYKIADIINMPFYKYVTSNRINNSLDLFNQKNTFERVIETRLKKLEEQNSQLICSLSSIAEFRNLEYINHSYRIKEFTKTILNDIAKNHPKYNLTSDKIKLIVDLSPLHDIGNLSISENILTKKDKLSPAEYERVKEHTYKSQDIIDSIITFENENIKNLCKEIAQYHHEKFDGSGYPEGLAGDEIPIAAQVVSLADCYDALISDRVYKPPFKLDVAFEMIQNGECGKFNPILLESFKNCKEEWEYIASTII